MYFGHKPEMHITQSNPIGQKCVSVSVCVVAPVRLFSTALKGGFFTPSNTSTPSSEHSHPNTPHRSMGDSVGAAPKGSTIKLRAGEYCVCKERDNIQVPL